MEKKTERTRKKEIKKEGVRVIKNYDKSMKKFCFVREEKIRKTEKQRNGETEKLRDREMEKQRNGEKEKEKGRKSKNKITRNI